MIAPRAVSLSRSPQHTVAEAKCGLAASRLSPENRVSYVPTTTPDNRKVSTCRPAQRQHAASVPTPACPRADAARGAQTGPSPRRPTRRVSAASGPILWQAAPQRLPTFLEYGGAPPMRSGDMRRAHASPAASSPLRPVLPGTGRRRAHRAASARRLPHVGAAGASGMRVPPRRGPADPDPPRVAAQTALGAGRPAVPGGAAEGPRLPGAGRAPRTGPPFPCHGSPGARLPPAERTLRGASAVCLVSSSGPFLCLDLPAC